MNKRGTYGHLPELKGGRVHEISGCSAIAFSLLHTRDKEIMTCASPHWLGALHPQSLARFCAPQRVLHTACTLEVDALWAAENALRAGCLGVVIVALERTPNLTHFRRLQLAAQAGNTLGLAIVKHPAHSSPAETRWHCTAQYTEEEGGMRLHTSLYKNKKGITGSWVIDVFGEKEHMRLAATPAGEPVWPQRRAG